MSRRLLVAEMIGIPTFVIIVLCLISWAGQQYAREMHAAYAIENLGCTALKYRICTGTPPSSAAELLACGLLEPTANPEEFIACGNTVYKEHADGLSFTWPDERSKWYIVGEAVVDENGREMTPIVILKGVPSSNRTVWAQRRMAKWWLAFKEGVLIENRDFDAWLHDCDEIATEK